MPEHKAAGWTTPIRDDYKRIVNAGEGQDVPFVEVERFAFYELAKQAYCVVSTGEQALYANVSVDLFKDFARTCICSLHTPCSLF